MIYIHTSTCARTYTYAHASPPRPQNELRAAPRVSPAAAGVAPADRGARRRWWKTCSHP